MHLWKHAKPFLPKKALPVASWQHMNESELIFPNGPKWSTKRNVQKIEKTLKLDHIMQHNHESNEP